MPNAYHYHHSDELTISVTPDAAETWKLYDVELHFKTGILAGMKITGFAVYQNRGRKERDLALPARRYTLNGEGQYRLLLQPANEDNAFAMAEAQAKVHAAIMDAVAAFESGAGEPHSDAALPVVGF